MSRKKEACRVAFTGAPFAGKTETWKLLGTSSQILRIQETADSLYDCGFPRPAEIGMDYETWMRTFRRLFVPARVAMQFAIEEALEAQAVRLQKKAVICDRTILDGLLYYDSLEDFLVDAKLNISEALYRYDRVIFFETVILEHDHPLYDRRMPLPLSRNAHFKLLQMWENHPRFSYVPACPTFEEKAEIVRGLLSDLL